MDGSVDARTEFDRLGRGSSINIMWSGRLVLILGPRVTNMDVHYKLHRLPAASVGKVVYQIYKRWTRFGPDIPKEFHLENLLYNRKSL